MKTWKKAYAILAALLVLSTAYGIAAMALPWIEDYHTASGQYSRVYAYVGAYTDGQRLINVKHDGGGSLTAAGVIAVDPYVSSDNSYAYTLTIAYIDLDGDGFAETPDAWTRASIYASPII